MRIIDTGALTEADSLKMGNTLSLWVYNGLDTMLTHEINSVLQSQLDPISANTYAVSKALQGPILEMNMRGVRVDHEARVRLITELESELAGLDAHFHDIVANGYGMDFSWSSPDQCKKFFYDYVGLPPKRKRDAKTGKYRPTVDRNALEEFQVYFHVKPVISHILALRDLQKQISNLRSLGEGDGRARTNFNIAGTNTGRLSSAWSDFGTGGNLQNVDRRLRTLYTADAGYKFANIDLEQADARNVGIQCWYLFRAEKFLNAAEGGDLHTTVSRMTWQELPWPEDLGGWRPIADLPFYREDSYRQTAKKLGHGTNFNGQPPTMALHTKTPIAIIEDFQRRYFREFPEVRQRIEWIEHQIKQHGNLTTLFGRRSYFFRGRNNPKTLNEACAFDPQSMTADEINGAMLNIFALGLVQMMLQVHDSLLLQYPEDREEEIVPLLKAAFKVPLRVHGRDFHVPCEVKTGWNWGDESSTSPFGLRKWKGQDTRRRDS